ncbi:MAG: type II secretion system F family protein [Lachnospiraceae bacterium]|nr:type II secretion system F family protein [Lachnospiraceae bacterium]
MDYSKYKFSPQERILYFLLSVGIIAAIAYLFYKDIRAFVILLPGIGLIFSYIRRELKRKRAFELSMEFKEALLAVQSALNAGYSVENAFIEARDEMERMYGSEGLITKEFRLIARRLRTNESLEKILEEFADRSGIEDIGDFSDVLSAAKRSGGDLNRIIRQSVDALSGKAEVKREIETLMSAKRFENRIMDIVPMGIILYINISSPSFLEPLYHSGLGVCVMSLCLVLYAVSLYLSERIVAIEV